MQQSTYIINTQMDKSLYKGIPCESSLLDFDKYVVHSQDNKAQLYSLIRDCQVDSLKIRCDVWRLCLGIINIDSDFEGKAQQLQNERDRYKGLLNKHTRKALIEQPTIEYPSLSIKNPLGRLLVQKPIAVPTKEEQEDKFLEQEVRKDVERTYQQREFFKNTEIIQILSRVLFIWAKEFPDISYKQGINEVGASVIWVYFQSTVDPNTIHRDHEGIVEELQEKYLFFHSNEHAEADIYSIFDRMMTSGHKEMFRDESENNKQINPNSKNNSPILQRIIKLSDIKFKIIDGELFRHIKLNEVAMRPFLLKWIRCIHTREFQLQESFPLWDNIFLAYHFEPNQGLYFIDCTTLAMLIYLRDIALKKNARFQIVQLYQKYPKVKGKQLQEVVNLAWTVKGHLESAPQKEMDKKKEMQFSQNVIGEFKVYDEGEYKTEKLKKQEQEKQEKQQRAEKAKLSVPVEKVEKKKSVDEVQSVTKKQSMESSGLNSPKEPAQKKEVPPQPQQQKKPKEQTHPLPIQPRKNSDKPQPQPQKAPPKPKPQQKPILKPPPPPPAPKQITFNITFDHTEWREIQSLMKKSIEQNTDLQSRSLTLKVMKLFGNKEQQELKRLQSEQEQD